MALKTFTGIIYKYTNKINGKVYIGQTINPKKRYYDHKNAKEDSLFHRAVKKYGFSSFKYDILFNITCNNQLDLENTLNSKETICIKYYDSTNLEKGYNILSKGSNSFYSENRKKYWTEEKREERSRNSFGENNPHYGKKHTEEAKEAMRLSKLGKPMKDEIKEKISKTLTGRKFTETHRQKIGKALKGRPKSTEQRQKLSIAKTGIPNPKISTKIVQFSLEGKFIKEFDSEKIAAQETGISADNIRACCTHAKNKTSTSRTAGGYQWRYKDSWEGKDLDKVIAPTKRTYIGTNLETGEVISSTSLQNLTSILGINISTLSKHMNRAIKNEGYVYKGYSWKVIEVTKY